MLHVPSKVRKFGELSVKVPSGRNSKVRSSGGGAYQVPTMGRTEGVRGIAVSGGRDRSTGVRAGVIAGEEWGRDAGLPGGVVTAPGRVTGVFPPVSPVHPEARTRHPRIRKAEMRHSPCERPSMLMDPFPVKLKYLPPDPCRNLSLQQSPTSGRLQETLALPGERSRP